MYRKLRQVRNLRCFDYETILLLPMQRTFYKQYNHSFTYQYSFVFEKFRYTNPYKESLTKALGEKTIKHLTTLFKVPYTPGEHFIKDYLIKQISTIQHQVPKLAPKIAQFIPFCD